MPYNPQNLQDLNDIISLIKNDNITDAAIKFALYLRTLDLGPYSTSEWRKEWKKRVYEFGEIFKSKDAAPFIKIIDLFLKDSINIDLEKKEAVEFIYSEILWNFFEQGNSYVANMIKSLIKKFPTNPEFHHTYSHYLYKNGNFDLSIDEAYLAFKMDQKSQVFHESGFNKCKNYFNSLLLDGKIDGANKILEKMRLYIRDRHEDFTFNNIIISSEERLSDHKIIRQQIENISNIAQKFIEKERGKTIELMGFFVAILGFIFINLNFITQDIKLNERLLLIGAMGVVLAFFATLISILFSPKKDTKFKDFFQDKRMMLIIILILVFIGIYRLVQLFIK